MKFWDASAIIPLCLTEPRTPLLKKIAQEDRAIIAWWGTPAAHREGFLVVPET